MARKRDDRSKDEPEGPFNNPFGELKARLPDLPGGNVSSVPLPAPGSTRVLRAVVRYERKGRGGREATLVEQLGLEPEELNLWLRELKKTLGCGGAVEGEALVFQGDQRDRLEPILRKRGVRRISVG